MNKKTLLLILICIMAAALLYACGIKSNENENASTSASPTAAATGDVNTGSPEPTPNETQKITLAPTENVTSAPTTEVPKPMPTIEPGKETYAGGILSDNALDYMFQTTGKTSTHRMLIESIAVQFFATAAFTEVSISCPSYNDNIGTMQFDLYAWQGSYEATLAEGNEPVASTVIVNYMDNAMNKLTLETALPDGEYLIYMTSPHAEEKVGIWAFKDLEGTPETRLYKDDLEDIGFAAELHIKYAKTPNVKAGPLQASGLEE